MPEDLEETLNAAYRYWPVEERSIGARVFGIYKSGPNAGRSKSPGCMGYLIGLGLSAAALIYSGITKHYGTATQLNDALVVLGLTGIAAFSKLGIMHALNDGSQKDFETMQR